MKANNELVSVSNQENKWISDDIDILFVKRIGVLALVNNS